MARIIYSGLVTSIRGSIGGTTFQNNAYGFTVKNKANMVKPNSVTQNNAKLVFSLAVKAWGSLPSESRLNWNAWASAYPQFAKNNPSSVLSGFAVFTKQFANKLIHDGLSSSAVVDPSFTVISLDTVSIVIQNSGGVLSFIPTWVLNDGSWYANVYMSRSIGPAQNFSGTSPRFIVALLNTNITTDITSSYVSTFGALPGVGFTVYIDIQLFNVLNGQVPAKSTYRVDVSA